MTTNQDKFQEDRVFLFHCFSFLIWSYSNMPLILIMNFHVVKTENITHLCTWLIGMQNNSLTNMPQGWSCEASGSQSPCTWQNYKLQCIPGVAAAPHHRKPRQAPWVITCAEWSGEVLLLPLLPRSKPHGSAQSVQEPQCLVHCPADKKTYFLTKPLALGLTRWLR